MAPFIFIDDLTRDAMASYSTNEFKSGLKVMLEGDPCTILENEFVKPGKGQAFNRVKLRNLKTNRVWEKTFKSGDTLDAADVIDRELQYLYSDGEFFHFMEPENFEQYQASSDTVGDAARWLREQDMCTVTLYNGAPRRRHDRDAWRATRFCPYGAYFFFPISRTGCNFRLCLWTCVLNSPL